jgi:hypothetical protein
MAFDRSGMKALFHGVHGATLWKYTTTDTQATVLGAGYFNEAADLLKLNDVIWVKPSDTQFLTNVTARDEAADTISVDTTPGTLEGTIFSWSPENAEDPPDTLTFTRATIAQVLTTTDSTTNWYQEAKSGEIRYEGLRRVEQQIATASNDFSNAAWTKSNVTVTGTTELVSTGSGTVDQSTTLALGEYLFAIKVRRVSGTISADSDVSLTLDGTTLNIGTEITDSDQIIQVRATVSTAGSKTVRISIASGITLNVEYAHVEQIQDTSDVFGGEVLSGTEYNANVNGVRYFSTANGNSVNASGIVTEATGSTITGGGYLPEPAATNQLTTVDFTDAAWLKTNTTITDNGINDLGLNEFEVDAGTNAGIHSVFEIVTTNGAGSAYFILKAGTTNFAAVRRGGTANSDYAVFNLSTGAVTEEGGGITSSFMIDLGNGWYKCGVITADTGGDTQLTIVDSATPGTAEDSFTGANETILCCHAQYETTDFPTSPIITSGSVASRNKDSLVDSTTSTGAEYTIFGKFMIANVIDAGIDTLWGFDDISNDRTRVLTTTSIISARTSGVSITVTKNSGDFEGEQISVGFSYKEDNVLGECTDCDSATDLGTNAITAINGIALGMRGVVDDRQFRGRIRKFDIYDSALTQGQLAALVV